MLVAALIIATALDEIVAVALLFHLAQEVGTSLAITWLLLAQVIPVILFSPLAGVVVDKFGAKRVLVWTAMPQAVFLVLLGMAQSYLTIYAGVAALSVVFSFSGPALFALIPKVSERAGLTLERTNSLLEISKGVGGIAGPIFGGLLLEVLGFSSTVIIAAVWSFIIPMTVFFLGVDSVMQPSQAAEFGPLAALRKSYKPILRNHLIFLIICTFGLLVFSTTFSDVVFIYFATLNLGASALQVGALIACWAIGLALAAWFAGNRPNNSLSLSSVQQAYLGGAVMGVCLLASGVVALTLTDDLKLIGVAVTFLIGGVGNGLHNVAVRNVIHRYVPAGQHGRAFAFYLGVSRVASLCGFFGGGLVGAANAVAAYLTSGVLATLAACFGWVVTRRGKPMIGSNRAKGESDE